MTYKYPLCRALQILVCYPLFVIFLLTAGKASSDDTLDALIADYKSYGLPVPPEQAELSELKWSTGTSNGVPQYRQVLALVEIGKQSKATHYWIGCHKAILPEGFAMKPMEATVASLTKTQRMEPRGDRTGFDAFPDVALAVQCSVRGWDDLARGLLLRSRLGPQNPFTKRRNRPVSHRTTLAVIAWNYWCEQFCTEKGDRSSIVEQLSRLHDGPHGLDSQAHKNVVEDMRRTLTPTESLPESVESVIDSLIDFGIKGGWRGRGLGTLSSAKWYESYRRLQQMGLEAVPALLEHTHDFRITRCIGSDDRGTWQIRIADVVRELLNGLIPEEFAYDFLIREGRGKCVDRAHVLHWWTETQQVEARDYLLANALSNNADGTVTTQEAILQALGRGYPEDFVKLFSVNVDRVQYPYALFEALGNSKASEEVKAELFLRAAESDNSWARDSGIRELLQMKHPQAVPLLVHEIRAIPRTPKQPYWQSTAGRFAQLVCHTDDARAWTALVENSKRVDIGQRLEMIQAVGERSGRKDDQVIDFLAAFLDDKEERVTRNNLNLAAFDDPEEMIDKLANDPFSVPSAGFTFERLSVRDFAALQLASKLGMPTTADSDWKDSDWETLRAKVREAVVRRDK